jgi:hypothetical protein
MFLARVVVLLADSIIFPLRAQIVRHTDVGSHHSQGLTFIRTPSLSEVHEIVVPEQPGVAKPRASDTHSYTAKAFSWSVEQRALHQTRCCFS